MNMRIRLSVIALSALLTGAVFAADKLPSSFTLGRYVPADAWLYVHGTANPEREWIDERWGKVIQSLIDSGVDEDVKNLIFPMIPSEHREGVREHLDRMMTAVKQVRWTQLVEHEFAFAERISSGGLSFDYLVLMRGDGDAAEHNFKSLTKLLEALRGFSDQIGVQATEQDGLSIATIGVRDAGTEKVATPIVWLFRKGDIIGLVMAPPVGGRTKTLADDVLAMLSKKKSGPAIVDAPRFKDALSRVKAPSDLVSYFDIRTMLGDIRGMFKTIADGIPEEKTQERAGVGALAKLINSADVADYIITSVDTKGLRSVTEEYTRYQPDKRNEAIARMSLNRKAFDKPGSFIPKNATSFSMNVGIDLEMLYDFLIGFLKDSIPGGNEAIEKLSGLYEEIGFEPKRDLFSWWSGEMIQVSMPAAVITPMGGGSDWAMMFRVKDAETATCRVNAAIDWANKKLQQKGQMLMVSPASCKVGSFRQVTHPMLAMVARPVIGVQDDWLVIAKSAETVDKCNAVAKGEAPSILEHPRFREEGLMPEGPVYALSFEDLSRRGEEWGGAAAAVGMMGGMAAGMMPPEVPQEAKQLIQAATGIVAKLAPVLQQVNFYSSTASRTTLEDDLALRKVSLTTYKKPKASSEQDERKASVERQ